MGVRESSSSSTRLTDGGTDDQRSRPDTRLVQKNGAQQSPNVGAADAQQLVRTLDQAGLLDFEVIAPGNVPALLRRAGW